MLYSLAQDQSTRGGASIEESGGDGEGSRLDLPNSRRGTSRGDPRLYRSQIGHSLRKYLLKRRCVLNIINILISATISLMTRDIFVKFPTILLKEMYNALRIDISDNQRTNFLFLIHEILYQRVLKPT